MENWGAVTYRETTLLVEEGVSSQRNRQWVAMVVGHELAHQWFGNLVTMAWWNDLWLNEGFASWIEYLAVDKLFPEWKMWTEFLTDDFASAQALDSLANTHPIEVDVPDPAMLDEIFDAISYAKGASIIRMLHDYLGAETFRHGLVSYLKHHQYGNATTADLWAALEEASGRPVGRIMGAWTSQAGFPLVTLEAGKLKQQRFLISPKQKAEDTLWPLTIKALGQSDLAELESENTQAPSGWQKAPWLKLNPGQTGFYHVLYRQQQLADLVGALQNKGLSDVDRWGVVDDVFATIAAGKLGSDTGLELLQVMQGDEDYIVWDGLRAGLGSLIAIANNEDTYEQLRTFGRWLIMPLSKRLGWEPAASEELFTTLLRLDTLMLAGSLGVEAVVAEARRRFQQGAIPADLRTGIYYTIGRNGDATDYEKLRRLYLNSSSQPQEAARLLGALGCFKQSDLADKTLDMLMDTQVVRPQDAVHGLATLLGNHHTGQQTWEFIQANWPELLKRYGSGGHMLSALPLYIAHALKTSEAAEEMVRFFKTNPHPAMARPIRQAEERVRLRVAWWRRDQDAIEQWLTNWEAGL